MRATIVLCLGWAAAAAAPACAPGDDEGTDVGPRDDAGDGWSEGTDGPGDGPADDGVVPDDGPFDRPDIPDTPGEVCDEFDFEIARVIPDMLIVLDRSNSMFEGLFWNPVRETIYEVTTALDREIWFGLMVFPNVAEQGGTPCARGTAECAPAAGVRVPCENEQAFAIRDALGRMTTCGGTPVAETLQTARTYLSMLTPVTGHPPFILLATDGAPNCNAALDGGTCTCTGTGCASYPSNCLDDLRTYAVIEEIRAAGIQLFVVGIAASEWRTVLDEMARRGGTSAAFLAEDPAEIRTAFEDIAGAVASCEFDMESPDPSADPALVNFYFDGEVVPGDPDGTCDAGWAWVDAEHTRVEFCGDFCTRILERGVESITATFGCPTILV